MSKQKERETENSGFLDGRDYTAAFLYKQIALIAGNGVYANELTPTATNENMSITHGAGHAWVNGVCYENAAPFTIDIDIADGTLSRYDSLVVRLNLSINEMYATVIKGELDTKPTPPEVVRNADVYDLKICDIYVPAGCTKITQAQITDRRMDSAVCGIPIFPIEHLDLKAFYAQIASDLESFRQNEEDFHNTWAAKMQSYILQQQKNFDDFFTKLTEDLSVLTYIQEYTNEVTLEEDTDTVHVGIADFIADEDVLFVSVNGFVCAASGYTVNGTGAEAHVIFKESRATGDTVEFRVLKSKIGSAAMASTFILVDVDGTVLTDNGAVLVL